MKKIILILPILILSGCAYYQPTAVSTNSIGGKYERPTGIAEGVARKDYFFPCYELCSTGEDSLKAAIANALKGKNADTLANVFVDRKITAFPNIYFPLWMRSEIIVTGTLVKYDAEGFTPNDKFVDILNLKNVDILWNKLLNLDEETRIQVFQYFLSNEMKNKLHQYLVIRENKKEITTDKENSLFKLVIGSRQAMLYRRPYPYSKRVAEICYSYDCLITLENKKWKKVLKALEESKKRM